MDILDVAEAIGSIVERVKTPTIDWKQRAIESEESEAESNELLEAATHEVGMAKSKLTQIGDLLVECGAPPEKMGAPGSFVFQTTALERAEWLKSKIVEIGGLGGKPRSHKPIPEILKAYDDALEKADKNVPLVGWVNRHREVTQQAILAVVEFVRKEPAQDPVTKSVETGGSAYPIRNFNSLVAEAITLAGGKPGTIHLFDAISNLSLERDRLRDELDAARKRIAQAEANAVSLSSELRAEKGVAVAARDAEAAAKDAAVQAMHAPSDLPRATAETFEELLESAYWRYDALHSAHYKHADPARVGPMAEREAFKCVARSVAHRYAERRKARVDLLLRRDADAPFALHSARSR